MQLFNIGTVLLNEDGTLKRDANGDEIDAYSNSDIMTFARKFTLDIKFCSSFSNDGSLCNWFLFDPIQVRGLDLPRRRLEATLRLMVIQP